MKIGRLLLYTLVVWTAGIFVSNAFAHGPTHNKLRYSYMAKYQMPAKYRERVNPLRTTDEHLAVGKKAYAENCAACHGPKGDGDGEAAANQKPPPAVLSGMYGKAMIGLGESGPGAHFMHGQQHHHPGISHAEAMGGLNIDAYNFWAISEGGEALESSMPAFKEILPEKEIWQILLYVANDFSRPNTR